MVSFSKGWVKWWGRLLGTSFDRDRVTIEILRQRYVDEIPGNKSLDPARAQDALSAILSKTSRYRSRQK